MEGDDVAQHADALVEGAVLIVLGERVLLQEVVLQEAGRLQRDLVALRQRVLQPGSRCNVTSQIRTPKVV